MTHGKSDYRLASIIVLGHNFWNLIPFSHKSYCSKDLSAMDKFELPPDYEKEFRQNMKKDDPYLDKEATEVRQTAIKYNEKHQFKDII